MLKTNGLMLMLLLMATTLFGQAKKDPDAGKPIDQVEKELASIAKDILLNDDTDYKFKINKEFIARLTNLLERPESYYHSFKLLETISILKPADDAFRIFTWHIVDKPKDTYYSEYAHYYFGLVQRKFIGQNEKAHYLVIPLMELENIPKGFENIVTDNLNWFGALYYAPKHTGKIPYYDSFYYKLVPDPKGKVQVDKKEKEQVVTFSPAQYRSRILKETYKLTYANHKRIKEKVRFYSLMGWNGWDNKSNYKVFDLMSFDAEDSTKINFGAPVIYFEKIPKARALFKYSDYSAFSMNEAFIKGGFMGMGKKMMIVYDHMSNPNATREVENWDQGADGTNDALNWYQRRGYFEWYRNVDIAEDFDAKKHKKEIAERQFQQAMQDSLQSWVGPSWTPESAAKYNGKTTEKQLRKQSKEAEQKLKEAGIVLPEEKKEEEPK